MLAPSQPPQSIILTGDCRTILKTLPSKSIHCCVTSPPYFGLRDYGVTGQMGLEQTPDAYVIELVAVFREIHRTLRDDGTCWLNLGDSYAGSWGAQSREHAGKHAPNVSALSANQVKAAQIKTNNTGSLSRTPGLKAKDLIGIPWRVAFALQADDWYLRQDIIWHKPNPMPESVTDRCTKAHEYIFMLTKSAKYYYDAAAIEEERTSNESRPTFRGGAYVNNSTFDNSEGGVSTDVGNVKIDKQAGHGRRHARFNERWEKDEAHGSVKTTRNKRSVWTVSPKPFKEAHFATFPPALIEPCILAGCPHGGIVLDPFGGAGTTGMVARQNGRRSLLIELNPAYAEMARRRIDNVPQK